MTQWLQKMLVFVNLLLLYGLVSCSDENGVTPTILYVNPNPNIPCRRPDPGLPCFTLSQYSQHQDVYFGSNTELHFLSGIHILSSPTVIEGGTNITELALVGEIGGQSKIISGINEGQASLELIEIESTKIESLEFSGINVLVGNSLSLTLNNLLITALNESAFTFNSIDSITGTNIMMENLSNFNSAGVINIRLSDGVFSNVTIENSSGNSIIIIEDSFVQFTGMNIFSNNNANKGSILMITMSTVTFDGFTLFQLNSCNNRGGALNIVSSNVTLTGETKLNNNSAKDGGAIQLDNSFLELKGLIDISNNWVTKRVFNGKVFGGAISSIESSITVTGNVSFNGNYISASFLMGLGGAICAQESFLFLSGTITFHHNYVKSFYNFGGAIYLSNSTLAAANVSLIFTNNEAQNGGAIGITWHLNPLPSTIKVEGTILFDANVALFSGGALFGAVDFLHIKFTGNTTLSRNEGQAPGVSQMVIGQTSTAEVQFSGYTEIKDSISTGATVSFQENVHTLFNGTTKFINNTIVEGQLGAGPWGVVQVIGANASITILGQSFFIRNQGGTILLMYSKPSSPSIIRGEVIFLDNDSGISLSASDIRLEGDFIFTRNRISSIGCIDAVGGSKVMINGTILMNFNTAKTKSAIYSYNSSIGMYCIYCHFSNNSRIDDGGTVFALRSNLFLSGNISFTSNTATNRGGAIVALNSEIFLSGHHIYSNNSAVAGGVLSLGLFSVIHLNDVAVTFENNRAERGAIFHHDDTLSAIDCSDDVVLPSPIDTLFVRTQCFFSRGKNVRVAQTGNTASDVGNILFGGNLKRCNRKDADESFIDLFNTDNSIQDITSNPYQIVFCKSDGQPNKNYYAIMNINTIPGKSFSLSVAGLNQLLKPISSTIRAEISADSNTIARLGTFQSSQLTNNSCAELRYSVFSQARSIKLTLYAEGPCNKLGTAARRVRIELGPCPDGFELVGDECTCEADLLKYTTLCNIDDETILNNGNFWAGGLYDDNGSYVGIESFPNCPFGYCKKEAVNFTLLDPDKQCSHYRSGTICGQCMVNYSLTLGEVQCSDCSKISPAVTFGLLILFAFVGILLIILLILLKMTVASGTLNGLIFYVNIVDANRDIFIPQASWLRVFISWLNLDFGFSTCFYSGMDMYGYTWLQFLFPFYIWMLIGILIVISRRSAWVTKRVGSSPVAVLATLILLSYAKLLRTVISVFYFGNLQLPHGETSTVWLYDGNVPYLQGKHLALFIFALLFFVLLFFPFNFLLVIGPWLQNISGERINESKLKASVRKVFLGWFEDYRIKSFIDTYTVAYNPQHQYWTGMFLILRCMLFLVFVTSAFRNSSATLMAVTTSLLVIIFLTRVFTGRIYKNWYVDILEGLFLLNLGILSVATSHIMMTGGDQQLVADISGGTSFILVITIVVYHAVKQVKSADIYGLIFMKLRRNFRLLAHSDDHQELLLLPPTNKQEPAPLTTVITLPNSN